MTMQVFWSVHFSTAVQDTADLVRLISFIDESRSAVLIVNPSKENPTIEGFLDDKHTNQHGLPNRLVLVTREWGFPTKVELERVEEVVRSHYGTLLSESEHYLFGQSTQDCVARMGRAIAYGAGFSYSSSIPILESIDVTHSGFPDFGRPIRPLEHVYFIEELCYQNRTHCQLQGVLPRDYANFVRIYDASGRLQRKEFVSLDSVISKNNSRLD